MGKRDLRTVIAPSWQARLSNFRISSVIKGLIGRSLDVFWRKRGMTKSIMSYSCLTRVSSIIKWILGTSPRMTIGLIFLTSTNMTGTAKAECVPYPDCASIGYTETSCETQAVQCPFDATKLYCLPCDSKYQYTCNGVGEVGEGAGCKGKYEACGCKSGYNYFCGINFCKLNYC